MGCTSSKKAHRRRQRSPPPYARSKSQSVGDSRRHAEIMMKSSNDAKGAGDKGKGVMVDEPSETVINAWELMEGLEEAAAPPPASLSWMHNAPGDSNSIVSDFDPEIISAFQKAMEDHLSPRHPLLLYLSPDPPVPPASSSSGVVIDAKKGKAKCPPNGERRVVCYFTSMRGIRKTHDDCSEARTILQAYGVRVDERDVWLHRGFKDELSEILGVGFDPSRLPSVFANCRYLGGAAEVRQMHEDGVLSRALEECEAVAVGICEACGDTRFVLCDICSGSHKVFIEEEEDGAGGFQPCSVCNENGLVRCPVCC